MFRQQIHQFVVFGASGDLAKRKIYPALHSLICDKHSNDTIHVIGYGRTHFERDAFVKQTTSYIQHVNHAKFVSVCSYVQGDYTNFEELKTYLDHTQDTNMNRIFYLSLPPSSYTQVVSLLPGLYSDSGWNRVVLEKPFGHDTASFLSLQEHVQKYIPSESLYLMDHYMGKSGVEFMRKQHMLAGGDNMPSRIHVLFSETLGVEGRQYFDESGIVRDIVQNHALQVLAVLLDPSDKLSALRDISRFKREDTTLKQYEGYPFQGSTTPTYMETTCYWKGVPIFIKAGKALSDAFVKVVIDFAHEEGGSARDTVEVCIQPESKVMSTKRSPLVLESKDAYEVMISDVITGDKSRYMCLEEIHELWLIVDDIVRAKNMSIDTYVRNGLSISN